MTQPALANRRSRYVIERPTVLRRPYPERP
jgi:hypothetical protein